MNRPKAVFFDLDETLVENVTPIQELFASLYVDFKSELGEENRDAFFSTLRPKIGSLWNAMFLTQDSPESQLISAFEESILGLENHQASNVRELGANMFNHFCRMSAGNVRLHSGVTETLAALRRQGFTTGIITNGIEQVQLGKIHALGLQDQVDHVVVSAQARAHKPSEKVFELALQRANVAANHAWQVGDHATNDVAGAIRAGMSGVFFDPSKSLRAKAFADLEVGPTYEIAQIPEVLELLS